MVVFNNPSFWVIALIAIPLFLILALLLDRRQRNGFSTFGQQEIFKRFTRFSSKRRTIVFFSIALLLMALAAAEPWLNSKVNFTARTLNTVIVLDVSKSMLAEDTPAKISRLKAGTEAVEALMDAYPDGQFAFVFYTDKIQTYPPSSDAEAVKTLLREIGENYQVRGSRSDIVGALEVTAEFIKTLPYKPDTIILISDGGTHSRDYNKQTVKELTDMNIRVISVGVGGLLPADIPIYIDGIKKYAAEGPSSLNGGTMRDIAKDSGGWYVHLDNKMSIVNLVRSKGLAKDPVMQKGTESVTWLPVTISMILIGVWIFLRNKAK